MQGLSLLIRCHACRDCTGWTMELACSGLMRGKALPFAEHRAPCIPAYRPPGRRRPHKLQAAPFTPTPVVSYVPVLDRVIASAPATIANLGPGFDWLGCAVEVIFRTQEVLHNGS